MYKSFFKLSVIIVFISIIYSCDNAPQMPKPSTYLRLNVEKPVYTLFNESEYPFTFLYPTYAEIEKLDSKSRTIKWFNLDFKNYGFVANVSLIPISSVKDLNASINDCHTFLKRHEKLSGGIIRQEYQNHEKKVYGCVFEIKGKDVVSPYQFYLTDSAKYFVRVALNSDFVPNNDSCEVIINQLKKDLNNMISTFVWK